MNRSVRIIAEYAGDETSAPDARYKLTVDAVLQGGVDQGKIVRSRCFGVVNDAGELWPFMLDPGHDEQPARMVWGGNEAPSAINLFDRVIKMGEFFTRTDEGADGWVYRITHVVGLTE